LACGGLAPPGWAPLSSCEIYHPAQLKPAPVLDSFTGSAQGVILHGGTGVVASPSNPALAGEVLEIYAAGLLGGSVIPPQVSLSGRLAEVFWFGNAPGFVGLNQINVRVPSRLAPGPAVPVYLTYIRRPSNEVTIGVR